MITFQLNGKSVSVDATPDTPLLWVLRDHLRLTGTKFGCGAGLCGACTVHLNGTPVRSCLTTISAVGSAEITTIEGLSPNGTHPLQAAWIAEQVPDGNLACLPGARHPGPNTHPDAVATMIDDFLRHRIRPRSGG